MAPWQPSVMPINGKGRRSNSDPCPLEIQQPAPPRHIRHVGSMGQRDSLRPSTMSTLLELPLSPAFSRSSLANQESSFPWGRAEFTGPPAAEPNTYIQDALSRDFASHHTLPSIDSPHPKVICNDGQGPTPLTAASTATLHHLNRPTSIVLSHATSRIHFSSTASTPPPLPQLAPIEQVLSTDWWAWDTHSRSSSTHTLHHPHLADQAVFSRTDDCSELPHFDVAQ
ncbi:hypothetical protein BCR44DRAFT_206564 [Catenaria anguillulae PL171]|uniref:Uncharacterized protein n=1 Tax=Catenaria anguillulae PL171 TaxID=765915 RepID=A0A1Y2H905_9FUNG|nr:hypothetical protein BCR44DRAFT_206564 [Catenaria anguillulae PL171]